MKKLLKSLFASRKNKPENVYGGFSEFFRHASREEKIQVFREAAHKANEEQREVLRQSHLRTRTG